MIKVGFKKLTEDAILPVKAHATDSGFDLFANEDDWVLAGDTVVISTGIAVKLPPGYEAQVRPRSGLTSKTNLRVQLGTVDQDYTGEIGIIVDNINSTDDWEDLSTAYTIRKGDKLAQLVVQAIPMVEAYEIDKLPVTNRGSNGFGSSGY